jgi:ankyrin repeat protein
VLRNRGLMTSFKKEGLTPLTAAVELNDVELCRKVLTAGVPINQGEPLAETALNLAISKHNEEISLLLLECGANPNQKDKCGDTPLHSAAIRGFEESCRLLIEHGAEINALNEDNQNPLCYAIYSKNEKTVRYLLQQKGNPNQVWKNGKTSLHLAAHLGSQGICQALVEKGADLSARNNDLDTPLHCAAYSMNEQLISYLLKHGADARALNKTDCTPLGILRNELVSFPEDHYLDLKEKDGGLTDLIHSLNLLGHRFSLAGPLFEGTTVTNTFREMANSLESYLAARQITDPFLLELPLIFKQSIENKENIDHFMKSIEEGKLTILPVGWLGHQTSLVIWNHLLCKVNRGGASGDKPGFKIYAIQNPENLRSALKKLLRRDSILQTDRGNFHEEAPTLIDKIKRDKIRFFNDDIDNLLELKQLHYLRNNYQKSGNCSWLAAKMSFKASLLLFYLQKTPEIEMDTILKQVKTLYSDWLNFDYARGLSVLPKAIKEPLVSSRIAFDEVYDKLLNSHFKSKRIALLEVLFQKHPELLQKRSPIGETLLHKALNENGKAESLELSRFLLEKGVNPNGKNLLGYTPLHCLPENDVEMAKLLIDNGADIGIKDVNGNVAAVIAAHPELEL